MSGRIVVFGATGYTGRLVVSELLARGWEPVIAGRSAKKVATLADEHGGLQTAIADVNHPRTVRALVEAADVLVTTVGPFTLHGQAALEAALDAGAHYVDSAGEPDFIRDVYTNAARRAQAGGCALLTGCGYNFAAGNLAGALTARDAGESARRVDVAYFSMGEAELSSGTRATIAVTIGQRSHALREGRLLLKPFAREMRSFRHGEQRHSAALVGGTEPLTLPRVAPQLTHIATYLGLGSMTPAAKVASYVVPPLMRLPFIRARVRAGVEKTRTGEGPDALARGKAVSLVLAVALDGRGGELATVRLEGGNDYDLTARVMAYTAGRLAAGDVQGAGALGPVDALGLDELEGAWREAGLSRV